MNLYSRLFLVSCLLTSIFAFGQQRFFLANPTTATNSQLVIRDSEDLNLEYGMFARHFFNEKRDGECPWFDLQVAPFYTHLKSIENDELSATYKDKLDSKATTQFAGVQFQAQLNICDFYIRALTQVGQLKNSFENCEKYPDYNEQYKDAKENPYKFGGCDDVTLKAGYNWFFCDNDHYAGLFMLGGFPVNNEDACVYSTAAQFEAAPFAKSVRLGVYSYRVGAGLESAFTLYNCDDSRLTWHAVAQYAYAFPRTYAKIATTYPEKFTEVRYTPGQFVSAWTALHYNVCNWGFELGSSFEGMFDEKLSTENEGSTKVALKDLGLPEKPGYTVSFLAKPYVAFDYNTTICDNPFTVGLGIGYEYDKMHDLRQADLTYSEGKEVARQYDAFQGVNVWGNLTYSF